jgi:hypothetical protein
MKIKATCGNCKYGYYRHDDRKEIERCKIIGRLEEFPVNDSALNAINEMKEGKMAFCEYHSIADCFLDRKIIYDSSC